MYCDPPTPQVVHSQNTADDISSQIVKHQNFPNWFSIRVQYRSRLRSDPIRGRAVVREVGGVWLGIVEVENALNGRFVESAWFATKRGLVYRPTWRSLREVYVDMALSKGLFQRMRFRYRDRRRLSAFVRSCVCSFSQTMYRERCSQRPEKTSCRSITCVWPPGRLPGHGGIPRASYCRSEPRTGPHALDEVAALPLLLLISLSSLVHCPSTPPHPPSNTSHNTCTSPACYSRDFLCFACARDERLTGQFGVLRGT